jgi:hypothetical protein
MNEKLDINVGSREKRAIILEFNIPGVELVLRDIGFYM